MSRRSARRAVVLPLAALAALPALPAAPVSAQGLSGFNVFTFGAFRSQWTDVAGTTAVGGDATFTSIGMGSDLGAGFTGYSVVVGGTLRTTWGAVQRGDVYAGAIDPASQPAGGWTVEQGTRTVGGPSPVDFAARQAELTALSTYLGTLPQTAGATIADHYGTLRFAAADPVLNVFALDLATWSPASKYGYQFAVPVGSTVLVNVVGAISGTTRLFANTGTFVYCTAGFASCPQPGDNQHPSEGITKLVYNLPGVDQTGFLADALRGSVLAPHATITTRSGAAIGDVVARSIVNDAGHGGIEFHPGFRGTLPTPPGMPTTSVPEPATLALTGLGLALLGAGARRRRRAAGRRGR